MYILCRTFDFSFIMLKLKSFLSSVSNQRPVRRGRRQSIQHNNDDAGGYGGRQCHALSGVIPPNDVDTRIGISLDSDLIW